MSEAGLSEAGLSEVGLSFERGREQHTRSRIPRAIGWHDPHHRQPPRSRYTATVDPRKTAMHGPTSHVYFSQRLRLHYVDWGN
ncbi:MAG: hypothetical protein ACKOBM_13800, partial [Gammaproteobacteria bacterium]